MRLMLGELRASHLDVGGGPGGPGSDGYTGMRFDPAELAHGGALRVAEVVAESPAALALDLAGNPAPVQAGEYLLAVDGAPLAPGTSLDALLSRTVGRRVRLRLAEGPEGEGREVALRPVDGNAYERLRYRAWVGACKAYVARVSGGKLGYVHIPHMSYASLPAVPRRPRHRNARQGGRGARRAEQWRRPHGHLHPGCAAAPEHPAQQLPQPAQRRRRAHGGQPCAGRPTVS